MTNLFDGVSFVVPANGGSASEENGGVDESKVKGYDWPGHGERRLPRV